MSRKNIFIHLSKLCLMLRLVLLLACIYNDLGLKKVGSSLKYSSNSDGHNKDNTGHVQSQGFKKFRQHLFQSTRGIGYRRLCLYLMICYGALWEVYSKM